ncbi:hypothetical protein TEA_029672 [Camellia sinensis var. sinensis]|uniref:Peptidase S8/S53 domain-containing protein n=1 Tax=Camellia sinensis var. sinensis TaxID=542762 RepID=A0A4S4EI16_CAMSN|nr:hypothetical protein TEA_029672 [Camellia sinensis var. sinensis]
MPPPPAKWKGKCELNGTACNKKLIGARNFISGQTGSVIDEEGHGTHTASTAAGNFVEGANVFGQANGTASGMAPLAHLAMYKVCGDFGCAETDILAAMDAAVEDGHLSGIDTRTDKVACVPDTQNTYRILLIHSLAVRYSVDTSWIWDGYIDATYSYRKGRKESGDGWCRLSIALVEGERKGSEGGGGQRLIAAHDLGE